MNEVGYNEEFVKLELQYGVLKEQVAGQIEMYTHLVEAVGPRLKSDYMMAIGRYEYLVYELEVDVNRWKRRFALRQQALNRGEAPEYAAIERQLDREFEEYLAEIKGHLAEMKAARDMQNAPRLTEEETTAIRCRYLEAVKKLHPDINPGLPAGSVDLWNQIQAAYGEKDWEKVRFLVGLVDSVVSGAVKFEASVDGMAALREACDRLRTRSRELAERTARLKAAVPFTYEALLTDEARVRERQEELTARRRMLEKMIEEYEEVWNHGK